MSPRTTAHVMPVEMAPNLIEHFYAGGARIAALRGIETTSPRQPEEWLAATVSRYGQPGVGLARTLGGDLLRDLVVADPARWLGLPDSDGDVGVLVKLLDAGARLPVHAHPDRAFASSHLGCEYGKTEAWYVLAAEPGTDAAVYLGWSEDVDPDDLVRARDAQDHDWLLGHLNRLPVRPGDGILVPAGTAHAIGEGVFLAEAQEPTDFSIVLEWSVTTSGREESHLGLGFDVAMGAVRHTATTPDELAGLVRRRGIPSAARQLMYRVESGPTRVLPEEADPYFRLHRAGVGDTVPRGFAVVLVLAGEGTLNGQGQLPVRRGQVYAVPAAYGEWTVQGAADLLVARPGAGWRGLP